MSDNAQNRKYPLADVKILYGQAKALCAFSDCRADLVLPKFGDETLKQIGKIAHIVAHSAKGPRSDPSFPHEKLDTYENWILLCPTHHDTVDALDSKYTVEQLRKIKADHEQWVSSTLAKELVKIGFAELEMVTRGICIMSTDLQTDYKIIPPSEKMKRNGLTAQTNILFSMGLCKHKEVRDYIQHVTKVDPSFPGRLKEGFVAEYKRLCEQDFHGDGLFEAMREFASSTHTDFTRQAAGLAVLTYLFETCEIFEK
jgi:hypothetical protein